MNPQTFASGLPIRVDFDIEMDVVIDEVWAEEAEEFAGGESHCAALAIEGIEPMAKVTTPILCTFPGIASR